MDDDPFNCPKCGAHDWGLFRSAMLGCPHCATARIKELEEHAIKRAGVLMQMEDRIRELEAALRRVDTALDQTSAVLWKSLKAEVKATLQSDEVLYNTKTPSATPTHAPDPERIASHACGYGCIEQGHPKPDCHYHNSRGGSWHSWATQVSEYPSQYLTSRETWYIKK